MPNIIKAFGARVRAHRQRMKLSQLEFAERANLHHTYICQIEKGDRNVSLEAVDKIINALGVSYEVFFAKFNAHETHDTALECYEQIIKMSDEQQRNILEIIERISDIAKK